MRLQIAQMRSPGAVDSAPSDAGVFPTFSSVVSQQDVLYICRITSALKCSVLLGESTGRWLIPWK